MPTPRGFTARPLPGGAWTLILLGLAIWLGLSPHAVDARNVDIKSAAQRTPKLLAVWSMQRSGTGHTVASLGLHPCIISVSELLNPSCQAAKDMYTVFDRLGVICKQIRADALPFLLKTHELLCEEEMSAEDREMCGGRCVVVFKVFEDWNMGNLSALVQHEDVATLTLERAVEPMFCSLQHSHKYHDWGHTPGEHKVERLSEDCPRVIEEASVKFKKMARSQERWFELVKLLHHNKTFLEVPFESITSDERFMRTYANIVNFVGLGGVQAFLNITTEHH
eukprot:gene2670-17159_t